MVKRYVVQTQEPDGTISLSLNTPHQIVDFYGFSDCSGCNFDVFDGSKLGEMVKLAHLIGDRPNHHVFIRSDTEEIEFEGYSTEH